MGGMMDDCLKAEKVAEERVRRTSAFLRYREPKRRVVYCSKCRFLLFDRYSRSPGYICLHPDNSMETVEKDWYSKKEFVKRINPPSVINKNNDCRWFEYPPNPE